MRNHFLEIVAIVSPVGPGLAGWAIFGLGVAAFAPVVLGAASQVAGVQPPVAIAMVTTVGYLGSFTGPVINGGLAFLAGPAFGHEVRVLGASARERH